jgi:hypothetical protein
VSDLHDAAVHLAELKLFVFPLKPRGKAPMTQAGFKDATNDAERVSRFWRKHPNANIGLYPGPSGRLVFDLDGPRGLATAERLGLLEQKTLVVRTGGRGGGQHRHHTHPGGVIGNLTIGEGVEVKADKGYVLVPPSVHPSGAIYEWEGDLADLRPLTEGERALLQNGRAQQPELETRAPAENGKIPKGGRNNDLTRYAGRLFASGLTEEEVLELVHKRNRELCTPPLATDEVNRIVYNIAKADREQRADEDSEINKLNERYALVIVGDKSAILEEAPDDLIRSHKHDPGFRLLTVGAFKDKLRPERIFIDERPKQLADHWLGHPGRRAYDRIVFAPGQSIEAAYNLWRGFAVAPDPAGDCGLGSAAPGRVPILRRTRR